MKKLPKEICNNIREEDFELNKKTKKELRRREQNPKFIQHKEILKFIKIK